MSRAAKTVLLGTLVFVLVTSAVYLIANNLGVRSMSSDDLSWLKREFRLSESEMQRIRQLHEGYLPKCREMCARIAAKQEEVDADLSKGVVPDKALVELATLRAQCQAQMLRHFQEVSQAMPAEQGKRYLSEMQSFTLGSQQNFERSMGEAPAEHHGHGDH